MDDFTVYGSSFEQCLHNLGTVLKRCKGKNLALNWEKCHFMVTEGIVLWHRISAAGLKVDQEKVSIIRDLIQSTTVKGIRSFLGHVGFYRRFIRDFSKIARPLCRLLEKDTKFFFDESCQKAFEEIKFRLVEAPIVAKQDWNREFEIMCDSWHSRVIRNQQYLYPKFPPTAVVKLLQYSGSRVEHRDGVSLCK